MIRQHNKLVGAILLVMALLISVVPGALAQDDVPEAFSGDEPPRVIVVRQLADGAFMNRYLAALVRWPMNLASTGRSSTPAVTRRRW